MSVIRLEANIHAGFTNRQPCLFCLFNDFWIDHEKT